MINNMRPIHPGEQFRDELDELGISGNALELDLRVPANRTNDILAGKRGITADTALRLARYFGTTAEFWMNQQTAYGLRTAPVTPPLHAVPGRKGAPGAVSVNAPRRAGLSAPCACQACIHPSRPDPGPTFQLLRRRSLAQVRNPGHRRCIALINGQQRSRARKPIVPAGNGTERGQICLPNIFEVLSARCSRYEHDARRGAGLDPGRRPILSAASHGRPPALHDTRQAEPHRWEPSPALRGSRRPTGQARAMPTPSRFRRATTLLVLRSRDSSNRSNRAAVRESLHLLAAAAGP